MNYKEAVQHTVWSEPDEQRRVRRLGTKQTVKYLTI